MKSDEISEILELKRLSPQHPWHVQETQAHEGQGLTEAFKILARMVKQFHKELSKQNPSIVQKAASSSVDATEV